MIKCKIKDIVTLSLETLVPQEGIAYHLYSLPSFDEGRQREEVMGEDIGSNKFIVPDKCILFNKLNVRFKRVWRIDNTDNNKLASTEFLPLIVDEEKVDFQYCYYLLISDSITKYLSGQTANTSGSHKRISPDDFLNIEVALPEMTEQKRIGGFLSSIDRKIDVNQALNQDLENLTKQIYDYWFVQFDFPDENGKPYKSSGGKMFWNETLKREIPEGWEVKKIGDICPAEKGSLITKRDAVPGHIKVVAAGLDFSYYHNASNRPTNTITVSGSGENAGFTRLWREEIFASDCSTIVHNNIVDVYITYYTLKSYGPWLYRIARKSAQPHIYPADVNDLPRIVAPASIISKVESVFHLINSQITLQQSETERLLSLRSYLLPLLMTGQVKLK